MRYALLQALLWTAGCTLAVSAPVGAQNPQNPDPDGFIVKFMDGARGRAALAAAGATVVLDLPAINAAAARIPAQALQGLANNPNIEYIEADVPGYPLGQTTRSQHPAVSSGTRTNGPAGEAEIRTE